MAKFFNSRAADEIVKQTRRLRDNPVATDALRLPVRIGGSRRKFGKLDADLATDDTTGVTVSIYSGDTDTGSDVDGVLLAPWIEADLNSGDWVEVIEWGGESYAVPVAMPVYFGKLDADLAYNSTTTVSIWSDVSTDSGANLTGVKPPPGMTEGTITSGSWVELKKWGADWHAFPLPTVVTVTTDLQVDGANAELEEKTRKVLASPVAAESDWTVWHTGDTCEE